MSSKDSIISLVSFSSELKSWFITAKNELDPYLWINSFAKQSLCVESILRAIFSVPKSMRCWARLNVSACKAIVIGKLHSLIADTKYSLNSMEFKEPSISKKVIR